MWTTLRTQLIFPFKHNFCNLFKFPANKIHSKINISGILALKIVKQTLLNLTPQELFNKRQKHLQIPINFFQFWFSKKIIGKNGSIINSFHTIAPKSLKPSRCTLTQSELISSKTPRESTAWSTVSWEISAWQIKTKHHASPPLLQL